VLSLAVALGFSRLFVNGEFLGPVILAVLAGHGVAWWCRRNDLPTPAAAVATIGAVALIASWTLLGHTTAYGIPLPLTVGRGLAALSRARQQFAVVRAPAPALRGFVLATVLAAGIATFMADWAAFRLQATFEALIPAFSLFLFTAALGTEHRRTLAVALFVATALGFVVTSNLSKSARGGAWFGGTPAGGPVSVARTAAVLGGIALVGGLVMGPRLPTADSRELLRYKNRPAPGPANRATISPLVDIRGRLVDRAGLEVFTVASSAKAYWRLTSLDTFDGNIWSSNDTYRSTRGTIDASDAMRPDTPVLRADQEFRVTDLASIWLPAAFRPVRVEGLDSVSYNRDTASLITPESTTDGDRYSVRSAIPQLTPELLRTAPAAVPTAIAARYLVAPPVDDRVRSEALRITSAGATAYDKARALQDYFHRGFKYDLNARPGHDARALENFLFHTKTGYCEQFSGAYAVMARLAGLPARVAVGFTPGELQSDGLYHVRDEHAHAWPEIYLDGFGWVAFEPTPGRGAPNAASYTGLVEAQDTGGDAGSVPTTTTVAPAAAGQDVPTTIANPKNAAGNAGHRAGRGLPAIFKVLGLVLGMLILWIGAVPALHLLRRRRRWRQATAGPPLPDGTKRHTNSSVVAAWTDVEEALGRAGISRRSAETMIEYSRRAAPSAGLQAETNTALRHVANGASIATFADTDLSPETIDRALLGARVVCVAVLDQLPWTTRVRWWLDPRPLLGK